MTATTPTGSSFVVQADIQGHYRIAGFSKRVDAKKVQITCSKAGYKPRHAGSQAAARRAQRARQEPIAC